MPCGKQHLLPKGQLPYVRIGGQENRQGRLECVGRLESAPEGGLVLIFFLGTNPFALLEVRAELVVEELGSVSRRLAQDVLARRPFGGE